MAKGGDMASMIGPDVQTARALSAMPPAEAAAKALGLAREIERLVETAAASATPGQAYTLRIASAISSSLALELETLAVPESRGPRSARVAARARS
jgi:hypothetical protein